MGSSSGIHDLGGFEEYPKLSEIKGRLKGGFQGGAQLKRNAAFGIINGREKT